MSHPPKVWVPSEGPVTGRTTVFSYKGRVQIDLVGLVEYAPDPGIEGGVIAECTSVRMAGT